MFARIHPIVRKVMQLNKPVYSISKLYIYTWKVIIKKSRLEALFQAHHGTSIKLCFVRNFVKKLCRFLQDNSWLVKWWHNTIHTYCPDVMFFFKLISLFFIYSWSSDITHKNLEWWEVVWTVRRLMQMCGMLSAHNV